MSRPLIKILNKSEAWPVWIFSDTVVIGWILSTKLPHSTDGGTCCLVRLEEDEGFESIRAYILLQLELHTCFDHFSTECKLEILAACCLTLHITWHVSCRPLAESSWSSIGKIPKWLKSHSSSTNSILLPAWIYSRSITLFFLVQ